ncbi:(2Fe-2S)-binding protein [Paenibacillus alba]|uniref:(2Fe-2S)-binding protein n=1 Tax=Paenibacillus alba TaxID=1197127 RepID=UPI00156614B9|nr:(2Fe-2S)-binding protein [Paenibacillus alba]NQX68741.1 (2Fe-2S)-binding protein [Paenibacillus alba]
MYRIDRDVLENKMNLTLMPQDKAVISLKGNELTEPAAMRKFLAAYAVHIHALDDTVAAAYFSSWFGDVVSALQYAVSIHDTALDLSLSNLTVHLIPEEGYTRLAFQLSSRQENWAPEEERSEWRRAVFTSFYQYTARPLMDCLAAVSGLPIGQAWGQLPDSLVNGMDRLASEPLSESVSKQVAEDYLYLQKGLEGELFGLSRNPFDKKERWIEDPRDAAKQLRMKSTCCLHYKRENRTYCYTCPRMKEADRLLWLEKLRSKKENGGQ